ncbi:DUF4380 domain-containing protein [Membranihabitans marinus]|uniref:DUF4380 domain-containing protein n=1 Tax=Membranihabitans marinus TaxID=1227546 RepID=UPI001F227D2C|nr:DUF4380 domain-containing protein [Membranihabitans marinus]
MEELKEIDTDIKYYKGWKVSRLKNRWMEVFILPEIGGRMMQILSNEYEYLFVNKNLEGQKPHSKTNDDQWENFGGEKIWPGPQGWGSDHMWPGPPDVVLDTGVYQSSVMNVEGNTKISLKSEVEILSGLQIDRTIELNQDCSEIVIHAKMTNHHDAAAEWSVWPVAQMNSADLQSVNRYCVTSPRCLGGNFDKGYTVLHGLVNNPQVRKDEFQNIVLDYQYLVGKIGIDNREGWVAYADRSEGKVAVFLFDYVEGAAYPQDTSVQIWTQGRGMIYSRGQVKSFDDQLITTPPYLEVELLSPLKKIGKGESVEFSYKIRICTIPKMLSVLGNREVGVIAQPLSVKYDDNDIHITGGFGCFYEGLAKLEVMNLRDEVVFERIIGSVDPLQKLHIDEVVGKGEFKEEEWALVILNIYKEGSSTIGELNRIEL